MAGSESDTHQPQAQAPVPARRVALVPQGAPCLLDCVRGEEREDTAPARQDKLAAGGHGACQARQTGSIMKHGTCRTRQTGGIQTGSIMGHGVCQTRETGGIMGHGACQARQTGGITAWALSLKVTPERWQWGGVSLGERRFRRRCPLVEDGTMKRRRARGGHVQMAEKSQG